jgi:hypothetical protein
LTNQISRFDRIKRRIALTMIGVLTAVSAIVGVAAPANAYWYNTFGVNCGSQTVTVKNTDGRQFSIAGCNSAWNVNAMYIPANRCVKFTSGNAVWTECYRSAVWKSIGAKPGGFIGVSMYSY